jgi:HK97 family phage portal protein
MMLKDFFNGLRRKEKETTIDEKILRALKGSLLRTGNVLEIQDNADSYIKYGYQGNIDVYSIIRRYITMSTQARLCLYQRQKDGSSIEVFGHPLNDFLIMANPGMTMEQFREAYTVYMLSVGNVFWYKPVLDSGINKGKSTQIYALPSNDVEVLSESHSIITPEIIYKLEGSSEPLNSQEVFHSKYFNPFFFATPTLYGQSPLQAAAMVLAKQNSSESTQAKQFDNQGPAYLMYRDSTDSWNTMSDPQKAALEKEINGLAKKGKQGGGIVLKDKFGVIKLGISAADLNLLETSKEGRRALCNIYSLPSVLFNDNESATYNNVIEARKAAWTDALIPHNNRFANDMTQFLIWPVEEYKSQGYYFHVDYSGVEELQSGLKDKVAWMLQARLTANEIREELGYSKIDKPEMDEPIFSQSDVLLSEFALDPSLGTEKQLKNYGDYK